MERTPRPRRPDRSLASHTEGASYPRSRALITLLAVCLLIIPARSQQDDPAPLIARIEAAQTPDRGGYDRDSLRELMDRLDVPGVSIAVIKDFRIHWAKGYGVADVATGAPVDTDTIFQAASISKPVAAMGVLRAVQDGKFSLDDDVNTILKSWKVPKSEHTAKQPVTPRSLLSHTSGADDGFGFPGYAPGAALPTVVQILNGEKPSNVGPVLFARPPYAGYKYLGRRRHDHAARDDGPVRPAVPRAAAGAGAAADRHDAQRLRAAAHARA